MTEPLANGDGLNVMIKREVVGFRANTVEKTGENRYRVWPNEMPADLYKARPMRRLTVTGSQLAAGLAQDLQRAPHCGGYRAGGWEEQLILTMTCEDGISVTHTLDGLFEVANNAEKALSNLKDGVAKLGQTIYYARNIEVNLPDALFVPNSLLKQFRRETAEMLDEVRGKLFARQP